MIRKITFILITTLTLAAADEKLLSFFHDALKTVQYPKRDALQRQASSLATSAAERGRFLNLQAEMRYGSTKAKLVANRYHTTDLTLTDTIDLFNKSADEIRAIALQLQQDRLTLQMQKKQLFLALADMITAYHLNRERVQAHSRLLKTQRAFLHQLQLAVKAGGKPALEATRFQNSLALLQNRITEEENVVETMRQQLHLYSKSAIPPLVMEPLAANLSAFLALSPELRINDNLALQSRNAAEKIRHRWLPDGIVGINRQYNDDPTANGDNYTLSAGIALSYGGGREKESERYKVDAMRIKTAQKALELEQRARYIGWLNGYQSAGKSYRSMQKTLHSTARTLRNMKKAYLKRYVDLNSYLQMLQENLTTEDALIAAKYRMLKNGLILNTLSKKQIY